MGTLLAISFRYTGQQSNAPGFAEKFREHGGVRTGRWQVTAAQHRPMQRDVPIDCARELLGVAFSGNPSKHYFVLRNEHMIVEADASIQAIMEKLQTYRNRLNIIFEGFQYQLGDFLVKAGRAIHGHGENLRGIVFEVEYSPISSLEKSRSHIQEFVDYWQEVISAQGPSGRLAHLEPSFSDYSLTDHYTWQHTALQYISLMANISMANVSQR